MKVTGQRFVAYAWPSGEVCVRVRGAWYGLALYASPGLGVHLSRHGVLVGPISLVWRRHVEAARSSS